MGRGVKAISSVVNVHANYINFEFGPAAKQWYIKYGVMHVATTSLQQGKALDISLGWMSWLCFQPWIKCHKGWENQLWVKIIFKYRKVASINQRINN